jgi:hypothetical protein
MGSSMSETDTSVEGVSAEESRAALQRVLESPIFERSTRLQQFLRFVCDLTLRGDGGRINEYLVGVEVFERTDGYDPGDDSIVRRQAHLLRQKLERYYATTSDPVRIELPMGRYVPIFRRATTAAASPPAAPAPASAEPPPRPKPGIRGIRAVGLPAVGLALFSFGVATTVVWSALRSSTPAQPAPGGPGLPDPVLTLWRPWLAAGSVTMSMTSGTSAVVRHLPTPSQPAPKRWIPLPAGGPEETRLRAELALPADGRVFLDPVGGWGKLREAHAAIQLAGLFGRAGVPVRATQSRSLTWERFRHENVIVIGQNDVGRWTRLLLERAPWQPEVGEVGDAERIVNRSPRPGEPAEYRNDLRTGKDGMTEQQLALISMLPGVNPKRELLVLHGLGSQATELAAEHLVSAAGALDLLARLRAAAGGAKQPRHFQAIFRAEVRDNVPTKGSIVALRLLDDLTPASPP